MLNMVLFCVSLWSFSKWILHGARLCKTSTNCEWKTIAFNIRVHIYVYNYNNARHKHIEYIEFFYIYSEHCHTFNLVRANHSIFLPEWVESLEIDHVNAMLTHYLVTKMQWKCITDFHFMHVLYLYRGNIERLHLPIVSFRMHGLWMLV